nr:SpvB/TcaC N-terminal domain-containing protein [uncultured Desulfobacter sp.]
MGTSKIDRIHENTSSDGKQGADFGIKSLTQEQSTESNALKIPEISLPKGGGALKGIDEKFQVNTANGTAGFSIPLPVSPGRNNFTPSLTLSYSSGGGNSPFGLGWSVDLPQIQRKTDKKLPQYIEGKDEDTFLLSGVEDLVPFLRSGEQDSLAPIEFEFNGYFVKRYRPRVEGTFSRIERIVHKNHGTYWKITTRENVVTIFGRSPTTRIANPDNLSQIYQWLPEFSYDDKGNWIKYHYKQDSNLDNAGAVAIDNTIPNHLHERNRKTGAAPFTNTYLKRVTYGNRLAWYADPDSPYDPIAPPNAEYFFELVFDYGEHDELSPTPLDNGDWDYRQDAFSSYRSSFEIRTNRLCKRVLMFHHFPDERQFQGTPDEEHFGNNYLVRTLDLIHKPSSINDSHQSETTYLQSIIQSGYIRRPDAQYTKKSLPPIEFRYEKLNWNKSIKKINEESIANAPIGLTNNYQWVDLYGEGISGILTEQAEGWYYKNNLGGNDESAEVTFTVAKKALQKPSFSGLSSGALSLQDLEANGQKQVVVNSPGVQGYYTLNNNENTLESFQSFKAVANINLQDPNTRLLDLNGDGQPELVITEDRAFTWYEAAGKTGHLSAVRTFKALDEENGPAIIFSDQQQSIFLADMSGDGLTDIVRIRNGDVCYWANLGYGHFSAKISMTNAPTFDHPETFNPHYLHLADVSGTGATDIIYSGKNTFKAFINLSGNAWSNAHEIEPFFPIDQNARLSVVDLLGTGTSCIVWSSDLPSHSRAPMQYIDLMSSKKPHVMTHYTNNLGKETKLEYKSSTHFYLQDKLAGTPWITKLPFPVQVVSRVVVEEKITDVRFASSYTYHHGYYDHSEREFRGFGRVEQTDTEFYQEWHADNSGNRLEKDEQLYQKPVLTKTWFHTGAFLDRERILEQFQTEYWPQAYNRSFPESPINITEPSISDARLTDEVAALLGDEYREALRACKGMMLRQEVFALDAPRENPSEEERQLQMKPFSVATHNCNIQLLQPRENNDYGVFLITESEAITINYERNEADGRVAHTLNTRIDELGNVLESVSVVYGRNPQQAAEANASLQSRVTDFSVFTEQQKLQAAFATNIENLHNAQQQNHIIVSRNSFAQFRHNDQLSHDLDEPTVYRTRLPNESQTYEITGIPAQNELFQIEELQNILEDTATSEIPYHASPDGSPQRRLIEHVQTRYREDDFVTPMPFGEAASLALPYENHQLAYTPGLIDSIYQRDGELLTANGLTVSQLIDTLGNYTSISNQYWIRSGLTHVINQDETPAAARSRFFSPLSYESPTGLISQIRYDAETFTDDNQRNNDGYYLFVSEIEDAVGNTTRIDRFNYRLLAPTRLIDINANPVSVIQDELGLVKATAIEGNGFFNEQGEYIIEAADTLSGLTEWTDDNEQALIDQYLSSEDTQTLRNTAQNLLQGASIRFVYDLHRFQHSMQQRDAQAPEEFESMPCHRIPYSPAVAASIIREQHFAENLQSPLQLSFEYSDGAGNTFMSKTQAEPGVALQLQIESDCSFTVNEINTGEQLRWVGNGRTILNNKGNPVKQYEPYFSVTPFFENAKELVERGVTPVMHYDSLGRLIRTDLPDGTFSRVKFNAWEQQQFDPIDTLLDSEWYRRRTDNTHPNFINDPKKQSAAQKATVHANTPSAIYLDSLGRPVLSLENNGGEVGSEHLYTTFIQLDIEGNAQAVIDARGNTVVNYHYDMLGHRVAEASMDDGRRWGMVDVESKPLHNWDERNQIWMHLYDEFNRPLSMHVQGGDSDQPLDHIYERYFYGEQQANAQQRNLRGQVFAVYDSGGKVENTAFDFKGNPLQSRRRIAEEYRQTLDWSLSLNNDNNNGDTEAMAELDARLDASFPTYQTQGTYDALNRTVQSIEADGSIHRPEYNEAGLLERLHVSLPNPNGGLLPERTFVSNIDYDEKGRRTQIDYADAQNDLLSTTRYHYDPLTFRLTQLQTTRNSQSIQNLIYTYDPVGNISEIEDRAIPTRFFNNFIIEPRNDYTYDALNRLIIAQGREHAGQNINHGPCDNWRDEIYSVRYQAGDDMAWQLYQQQYQYDPVGNILQMQHSVPSNTSRGWTRNYNYAENNNRLLATQIGEQAPYNFSYHQHHGFITSLSHLSQMRWNFKDELQQTATQQICTGQAPESTWYTYDGGGQRIRKVTDRVRGQAKRQERIYLGNVEIYRSYDNAGNLQIERQSLHINDDTGRIALIETRIQGSDEFETQLTRYQFSNHLGSANLEMDDSGNVISYEEYHPYGTTSYQANSASVRATAKRYRYTGMERDEDSGLNYHSARYYLPWLGRWLSIDPIGIDGGVNVFNYANSKPISLRDPSGKDPETETDWSKVGYKHIPDVGEQPPNITYVEFEDQGVKGLAPGVPINAVVIESEADYVSPEENFYLQREQYMAKNEKAKRILEEQAATKMAVNTYHKVLDIVGFVPGPVGVAADGFNAVFYAMEGDIRNAAISGVSAIAGAVPVKPVEKGMVVMQAGSKKATQAQAKKGRLTVKSNKAESNQNVAQSEEELKIKHKTKDIEFETRPATEAEKEFLKVGQETLIKTKSPAQAGTAAHKAAGANAVGSDLVKPGRTVEIKTHQTKTVSDQQLNSATKQSIRDTQKIARENEGLLPIRIVKHYFINPMIHGTGVVLKRYF